MVTLNVSRKAKKTKIERLQNGKLKLSKESDTALAALAGKKPENLSGNDLKLFFKAVAEEMGWLDEQGKIK